MAAPLTVNGQKTIPILWRERILKREFDEENTELPLPETVSSPEARGNCDNCDLRSGSDWGQPHLE
jgi:hypothetical protein